MTTTLDCVKCGAALSSAAAVNGYVKCEYCGSETRIAGPVPHTPVPAGPVPVARQAHAPTPFVHPPPPRVMSGASGGGGGRSWIVLAGALVIALVAGSGVVFFLLVKRVTRHRGAVTWTTTASRYRGKVGKTYSFRCPANGVARTVWGSGPYTDDSSICTAAVHAGLIQLGSGGRVTVEIVSGQGSYRASERHGVRTSSFGTFSGSFFFPAAKPVAADHGTKRPVSRASGASGGRHTIQATWATNAGSHHGKNGARFVYICPPGGRRGNLWGNNPYTGDSSVCTAAVHAGAITLPKGGRVEVEIAPGRSAFPGSRSHGVTARAWAAYPTSFRVVGAPAVQPARLPAPP